MLIEHTLTNKQVSCKQLSCWYTGSRCYIAGSIKLSFSWDLLHCMQRVLCPARESRGMLEWYTTCPCVVLREENDARLPPALKDNGAINVFFRASAIILMNSSSIKRQVPQTRRTRAQTGLITILSVVMHDFLVYALRWGDTRLFV